MKTEQTNAQAMHEFFVILTRGDKALIKLGEQPEKIHYRSFSSEPEFLAYKKGSQIFDFYEGLIGGLRVDGPMVTFVAGNEDGDDWQDSLEFASQAEAEAFTVGLSDYRHQSYEIVKKGTPGFDFLAQFHFYNKNADDENFINALNGKATPSLLNRVPTVVLYKTADQITRVVASQPVRVIVLDADGVDLEEEAPRVIQIGDQELMVTDLNVAGAVGSSPYGEQGVDVEFVKKAIAVVEALPAGARANFNKPGKHAEPFPIIESVPVKHWDQYHDDSAAWTHQIDLVDQRMSNGQLYVTVGAREGEMDDLMSATAEVSSNPLNPVDAVPCIHVHFDGDNLAFSLFKTNDQIILRPEKDVSLSPTRVKVNGETELIYLVD